MLLVLVAGCTPGIVIRGAETPDASTSRGVEEVAGVSDTGDGSDGGTDTTFGAFPLDEEGCPSFYAQDRVQEISLDMDPSERAALETDRLNYQQNLHPAVFSWEGE